TATLAGGRNPTGTMTFTLFGPGDTACATPIFTSPRPATGNGAVTSGAFTANAAGTYRWIASYSGDANNVAVTTACPDPAEADPVAKATPTLTTQASQTAAAGSQLTDTATLASGFNPTGTMTFTLFGPDNATCAGAPAFSSSAPVTGNGTVSSSS